MNEDIQKHMENGNKKIFFTERELCIVSRQIDSTDWEAIQRKKKLVLKNGPISALLEIDYHTDYQNEVYFNLVELMIFKKFQLNKIVSEIMEILRPWFDEQKREEIKELICVMDNGGIKPRARDEAYFNKHRILSYFLRTVFSRKKSMHFDFLTRYFDNSEWREEINGYEYPITPEDKYYLNSSSKGELRTIETFLLYEAAEQWYKDQKFSLKAREEMNKFVDDLWNILKVNKLFFLKRFSEINLLFKKNSRELNKENSKEKEISFEYLEVSIRIELTMLTINNIQMNNDLNNKNLLWSLWSLLLFWILP